MSEPLIAIPPDGWTVDDLDAMPVNNYRYELTDGALTMAPSPSSLHQLLSIRLGAALDALVPEPLVLTGAVDIRFHRQLTRIPDVMVVRSDEPGRHWFAPSEVVLAIEIESPGSHVEDRTTKPALYAQHGIPHFWRIELSPVRATTYRLGPDARYTPCTIGERITVTDPFDVDLDLVELLPPWAR